MIGIYKITSPSGKNYIGQSINIEKRFSNYYTLKKSTKNQIRLYNSFIKYQVENHIFEIIEECNIDLLNERERYWQEHFSVIGKNGLNCQLTNTLIKKKVVSFETKKKISIAKKGKKQTIEHKNKITLSKIGRKLSEETKNKISISHKKIDYEIKKKIGENSKGWFHSEKTKKLLSDINKKKKIILDLNTGVFYNSLTELANLYNLKPIYLSERLRGRLINKTQFIYV